MQIRDWMQEHRAVSIICCLVVLIAILGYLAHRFAESAPGNAQFSEAPPACYFYDLKTGALYSHAGSEIIPVDAPSDKGTQDKSGVWARVYSCGSCADASTHFTGYLQKLSPELIKYKATGEDPDQLFNRRGALKLVGTLVAPVPADPKQDPAWVQQGTDEGDAITEAPSHKCAEGQTLTECSP